MIDFSVAYDKLAQFQTADELADFFRSEGLKAVPQSGTSCAISQWMTKTTGDLVYTTYYDINFKPEMASETMMKFGQVEAIESNTPAMAEFARKFDNGQYPDLVDFTRFVPNKENDWNE
jgi:hypothetical protein